jgi:hypothetical protein
VKRHGKLLDFTARPPYLQGKIPGTHRIGGLVGSVAFVDDLGKRKSCWKLNHDSFGAVSNGLLLIARQRIVNFPISSLNK